MFSAYLITLISGGLLLLPTILGGLGGADAGLDLDADVDVDLDLELDADLDVELDADATLEPDASLGLSGLTEWFPITSFRFWLIGSTFFGLTGTLLTTMSAASSALTLALSLGLGVLTGSFVTRLITSMRRDRVDSVMSTTDLNGVLGRVLLPVSSGQPGKIRVQLKGRLEDYIARTHDVDLLPQGTEVLVYRVDDLGQAWVKSMNDEMTITPSTTLEMDAC